MHSTFADMAFKEFTNKEIVDMDMYYRIQLINSIGGFKSICLIGSKNGQEQSNVGIFNSVFHLGSAPALYGFVCRPANRERHTLENILETKSYTINQVHHSFYNQAHQTSAKYQREVSEFEKVNLSEEYIGDIHAPFVKESKIKFGLELAETHDMMNKNTIIIGRVVHVKVEEKLLDEKGFIQLDNAGTITGSGCDAYYETNFLQRLPYARPGQEDQVL